MLTRWLAIAPALALACVAVGAPPASDDDVYPADITPPPGTQYHCALTVLPRGLPGVPEAERDYVNRTYARVLRATQAKLVVLKALEDDREVDASVSRYQEATTGLAARLRGDVPPAGLKPFQDEVAEALALQQTFFTKAAPLRQAGKSMADVYAIPEGRRASALLISAFGRMQSRYPAWSAETRDSIYHHLCALDLF